MHKDHDNVLTTIAYYLGQFHPLEENNKFWGEGFTEWHNVAKARPLYPGHVQPVLPGRFGFYDLRSDKTILEQLDYAKAIGINAFCYWHYWFAGKRVLYRPLDKMIALPDRGVKIMLGWANISWSGIWQGLTDEVIIEQTYNRDELHEHAKLIASYMKTDRYLRVNGLSPFLVYKPLLIPDTKDYLDELRECIRKHGGGDVYLIGNWSPERNVIINRPNDLGLDSVVATNVTNYFESKAARVIYAGARKIARTLGLGPRIRHYRSTIDTLRKAHRSVEGTVHSCVVTGWDTTPRMGRRGHVLRGYNKESFMEAVLEAMDKEKNNSPSLLFFKSWNEWAEGNTIEPKFNEKWNVGETLADILSERV